MTRSLETITTIFFLRMVFTLFFLVWQPFVFFHFEFCVIAIAFKPGWVTPVPDRPVAWSCGSGRAGCLFYDWVSGWIFVEFQSQWKNNGLPCCYLVNTSGHNANHHGQRQQDITFCVSHRWVWLGFMQNESKLMPERSIGNKQYAKEHFNLCRWFHHSKKIPCENNGQLGEGKIELKLICANLRN